MTHNKNPAVTLPSNTPSGDPDFLQLASHSTSSRLLRVIERIGMAGSIFLACATLSVLSVALASLTHHLSGDPIGATGLFNTAVIPFVLGAPTLIAVFSLLQRLEATRAELARLSTLDMLTGALSRRSIIAWGELACQVPASNASASAVVVALMDVDQFKRVNDEHGHLVGDETLRQLSDVVKRHLPAQCQFGRYGGEEFAVIMPDIQPTQAAAVAELLREAVQAECAEVAGHPVAATVSIGLASGQAGQSALSELLNQADGALYEAKRGGRNQVIATS